MHVNFVTGHLTDLFLSVQSICFHFLARKTYKILLLTHLHAFDLEFFYLILILLYLPFLSAFSWEIFSYPFIFSLSVYACGMCELFNLDPVFKQDFFLNQILEYLSIHSLNKHFLKDSAVT